MLKLIAFCALTAICMLRSQAQVCSTPATVAPDNIIFGHSSGGYQVFPNNSSVFVETVDYIFNTPPPSVLNFSYDLASSSAANPQVTSYTATLYYRTANGLLNTFCAQPVAFTVNSETATTWYFSVPATGIPLNTRFFLRLILNVSGVTNADIIGSNIKLDEKAIQLPVNSTLPVRFTAIEARKQGGQTIISWKVAGESNTRNYDLERSVDGRSFAAIRSVNATNAIEYSLTDMVTSGATYYRIRNNDADGKFNYSPIVKVDGNAVSFVKRVFPHPVISDLTIQHGLLNTDLGLSLYSTDGRLISTAIARKGSLETVLNMSSLPSGIYFLRYSNREGLSEMIRVSKQ